MELLIADSTLRSNEICSRQISEAGCRNFPWKLAENENPIKYGEVINYGRRIDPRIPNCVMCGKEHVHIPSQNKDVCKSCDSSFWYSETFNLVFKFCKGCKNFFSLSEFHERIEASKCGKCRKRGRDNYINKKLESGYSSSDLQPPKPSFRSMANYVQSQSTGGVCMTPTPTFVVQMGNAFMPLTPVVVKNECSQTSVLPSSSVEISSPEAVQSLQRPPKVPRKISFQPAEPSHRLKDPVAVHGPVAFYHSHTTTTPVAIYPRQMDGTDSDSDREISYKKRRMQSYVSHREQQMPPPYALSGPHIAVQDTFSASQTTPGKQLSEAGHTSPLDCQAQQHLLSDSPISRICTMGGTPECSGSGIGSGIGDEVTPESVVSLPFSNRILSTPSAVPKSRPHPPSRLMNKENPFIRRPQLPAALLLRSVGDTPPSSTSCVSTTYHNLDDSPTGVDVVLSPPPPPIVDWQWDAARNPLVNFAATMIRTSSGEFAM